MEEFEEAVERNVWTTQEGEAGLDPGCVNQGRRTADPHWGILLNDRKHFEELLNSANTSSVGEDEASPVSLAEVSEAANGQAAEKDGRKDSDVVVSLYSSVFVLLTR